MNCQKCNYVISDNSKFCPKCGNEVEIIKQEVKNSKSMKTLNLVISIIYSVILLFVLLSAEDLDTFIGVIMLSGLVVTTWINYAHFKNEERKQTN